MDVNLPAMETPSDLVMIRSAIKNEYPISDAVRKLIVNQMALIIGRDESSKMRVAASRVLIAADAVNAKREALQQAEEHKGRPDLHLHAHAHREVHVIRSNDFFNNNAHDLVAESTASPDPGAERSQPI